MRYARPAVDLGYLFGSSLTPESREKNVDSYLATYHGYVGGYLETAGIDVNKFFTLDDLKSDYKDCSIFRLMLTIFHSHVSELSAKQNAFINICCSFQLSLSTVKLDMDKIDDVEKMMADYKRDLIDNSLNNPALRQRTEAILKESKDLF